MADELTPAEQAELQQFLLQGPGAKEEEKYSHHKFLHDVAESIDTTKTGFLTGEELGVPKHPTRTYKKIALICSDIMDIPYFATHFTNESEILTSTSLSKDAKLLSLAVIQRRQLEDVTRPKKKKAGGWFKKKGEQQTEE